MQLTIDVPDAYIGAHDVVGAMEYRADNIETMNVTQKILAAWGKPDVASLNNKEKAELVLLVFSWQLTKEWEKGPAMTAAGETVEDDNLNDFNP